MAREEKFVCPNVDCGHVDFSEGECPVCASPLVRPKGDDYRFDPKLEEEESGVPMAADDLEDPDEVSWYSEGGGEYGVM